MESSSLESILTYDMTAINTLSNLQAQEARLLEKRKETAQKYLKTLHKYQADLTKMDADLKEIRTQIISLKHVQRGA